MTTSTSESNKKGKSITNRLFKRNRTTEMDEFQTYILSPTYNEDVDPLEWWKINENQYPRLSKMARDFLAIPSTSVPSEQCFSISKNLITNQRNRLAGKTVRACMCLKSWWSGLLND